MELVTKLSLGTAVQNRHELRVQRAQRLHDCGWPGARQPFQKYLLSIPEIPKELFFAAQHAGAHLILADERMFFRDMCRQLTIWFPLGAQKYLAVDLEPSHENSVYWFAVQFESGKFPDQGITIRQGMFVYAQFPHLFWDEPIVCSCTYIGNSFQYRACFMRDTGAYSLGVVDATVTRSFMAPAILSYA